MIEDLYTIERIDTESSGADYAITLNPSSVIYSAHFPSMPVTPGACLIEMMRRAASLSAGRELTVRCVKSVKFLKLANPDVTRSLMLHCEPAGPRESGKFSLTATISDDNALYAKAQLELF